VTILFLFIEEECDMATRAQFDASMAALSAAIAAASLRFGSGGAVITDQDIAALDKDTANVNLLGTGGGAGSAVLSVIPSTVAASAQAAFAITLPSAVATDEVWTITASSPVLTFAPTVTVPAGQMTATFKATAGTPAVDTPCTVTVSFGSQTASVVCTVAHV
jgi:hypothetical protein